MASLEPHLRERFERVLTFVDEMDLDPDRFSPAKQTRLVELMEAACPDGEAVLSVRNELVQWIRWRRAPAYYLAWALQDVTSRRRDFTHVEASILYCDAL